MPPQEKLVVYRHLCREVEIFMPQHRAVEDIDLQNLLESGTVRKVVEDKWLDTKTADPDAKANVMIEEGGHLLYSKGVQTDFFTFILDGKAEVFSGRQKFRSEASRFTIFCPELLSQTQHDHSKGLEFSAFVPDFTARVIQNSRILRIPRENFLKCLLGKLRNYAPPFKQTRQKMREIKQWKVHSEGAFARSTYGSSKGAFTSSPILPLGNSNSDLKKSYTLPPKQNSRQRFYDKSYLGHELEGEDIKQHSGSNLVDTLGSPPTQERKNSNQAATTDVQIIELT